MFLRHLFILCNIPLWPQIVQLKCITFQKGKRPNLFKNIDPSDEKVDFDLIFEHEVGKAVSRSTKLMRDGSDIHPSFDFVFDDEVHAPELNSRLTLPKHLTPTINIMIVSAIKKSLLLLHQIHHFNH